MRSIVAQAAKPHESSATNSPKNSRSQCWRRNISNGDSSKFHVPPYMAFSSPGFFNTLPLFCALCPSFNPATYSALMFIPCARSIRWSVKRPRKNDSVFFNAMCKRKSMFIICCSFCNGIDGNFPDDISVSLCL